MTAVASEPRAQTPAPTPHVSTTMTGLSWALVVMLVLAAILNYLDRQTLSTLGPTILDEFHLSKEQWGNITASFSLVYIFSSLLGGWWIDRVGVRNGLLISTLVWSIAAAGHAFAHSYHDLCFWRMMLALGEGPGAAALAKGMRRVMVPRLRDTGSALIGFGWAAGALLAPLIAGFIAEKAGWRGAFLATGGLCVLWIPMWAILAYRPAAPFRSGTVEIIAANDTGMRRLSLRSFAVWATVLGILCTVSPTVFINNFLPLYLKEVWHLQQFEITRMYWQPFLATDIGQLLGGLSVFVFVRWRWRYLDARTLVMTLGMVGAATILLARTADSGQHAMYWIDLSRLSFQAAYTVLGVYGIESVAENQTALMSGLMNATFSVCNYVLAPRLGRMVDQSHGYDGVLLMIAVLPIVGLVLWIVLSRLDQWRHDRQRLLAAPSAMG
ncbi:MAG: MFS transporter [Planctomycetes bacterium]|nr:MFS transporter [Planctomycetota bacterium]